MHIWMNLLDNAIKFSPSKGTIYDAFGFVLCNYDCMSAFSKSVFTGTWNAVKYCGTGCVDSVRMP